ncbi:conserved hypothetical protein [Vibrio chagasii]|nr:conserved hypothetical protein [Vibrio chagasii]
MKHLKILSFSVLLLTGCSSPPSDVNPVELSFTQNSMAEQHMSHAYMAIVDSAAVSSEALRELSQITNGLASLEMTKSEYDEYIFQKEYVPVGMERVVDLSWYGDFYPLITTLAEMSGYELAPGLARPIGRIDVDINTTSFNRQLNVVDIIRMINDTHKDKLSIVIHEPLRVIEIEYL